MEEYNKPIHIHDKVSNHIYDLRGVTQIETKDYKPNNGNDEFKIYSLARCKR